MSTEVDGKRVAYVALPSEAERGKFVVAICREREAGYRLVPDYGPYDDEARCEGVVDRLNERIAHVTKDEARLIVTSTMGRGRRGGRGVRGARGVRR